MIPVNSMTEKEISSVAEAFADYSYASDERGLIYLFPEREALINYLKVMVRAGLKAGMVYTNSENREGFIMAKSRSSGYHFRRSGPLSFTL